MISDLWSIFTSNWQNLIPSPWCEFAESLVALACGITIGSERERREKAAGLRAITLVCFGATIFTQVGFHYTTDAGKVMAQIVTGVGFLGAGVIMRSPTGVVGITTAATIWVTAAIGAAAGAGYGAAALLLSAVVRFILTGLLFWQHHLIGGLRDCIVELVADPDAGKTRIHIVRLLDEFHIPSQAVHVIEETDVRFHFRIHFRLLHLHRSEFLEALANLTAVQRIQEVASS